MLLKFKDKLTIISKYLEVNLKFIFKAALVFLEDRLKQNLKIQFIVSGGLAAQLNAVAYLIWIKENLNRNTSLLFIEKGTVVRKWEITNLTGINVKVIHSRRTHLVARTIRLILRPFTLRIGLISKNDLLKLPCYKFIVDGYHLDISILEESIPTLRYLISQTGHPNFLEDPATEENLVIHWRLGDYVTTGIGNTRHGYIETGTIIDEINKLRKIKKVSNVNFFTDSKEIAHQKLGNKETNFSYSIHSNEIWSDLFRMSKAKYFIANHSGISVWVILAIKSSGKECLISVPRNWFKDISNDFLDGKEKLQLPQYHFSELLVYDNKLH